MKKIYSTALLGVQLLLATASLTSCNDANDWEVDSAYDRLFHTTSLSVSALATEATVSFKATPNTNYYVLQISKDSLYNDMDESKATITTLGEDKSFTTTPIELTDLDSNSKYFIRLKGRQNETGKESNWAYLDEYSFKTKSEQIMYEVTNADKSANSVTLSWETGKAVTKIEVTKDDEVVKTQDLDNDAITNGTITVTGLEAETTYTVNLYNNDIKRGYATFTTFPAAPEADEILYLDGETEISSDYLTSLAELYPGKSITLALASEATYTVADKLVIPEGMSINFFGLPGNTKTVLTVNQVDFAGTHDYVKFKNLDLDCMNNGYVMNQSAKADVKTIEFDDCKISNVKTTFFRLQGSNGITVNNLIVNNCICYNIGSGYAFVHVDAGSGKGVLKNLVLSNSTFNKICPTGKNFIFSKKTNMESISISNCTFFNVIGASNYFTDFNDAAYGAAAYEITNCIMGSTGDDTVKGVRAKLLPNIVDTYATTDWYQASNAVSYTDYSNNASTLFTDPANGDFTIKDNTFKGKNKAGDPRWFDVD